MPVAYEPPALRLAAPELPPGLNPFAATAAGQVRHRNASRRLVARSGSGAVADHFGAAVGRQIALVAAAIERGDQPPRLPLDVPVPTEPMRTAYAAFYRSVVPAWAARVFMLGEGALRTRRQILDELDEVWRNEVESFLSEGGAAHVTMIDETTRSMIRDVLSEAADEGWGPVQAARELRKRWDDLKAARAERIARTEILGALNRSQIMGARATAERFGVLLRKVWLWSGISRVEHAAASGQQRPLDGLFDVGGEQLEHPGDPSASPGNIVNCGCTTYFEIADE